MTRDEVSAFLARRDDCMRRRDAAALAADHAEQGVVSSPLLGTIRGRAAIEASYRSLFATLPDLERRGETTQLIDLAGGRIAQAFRATGSQVHDLFGVSATGRRFEIQGVLVYTMNGPLIEHEERIYDFTALLIQLGVIKAKPV